MIAFLAENLGSLIVLAVLLLAVGLIIGFRVRAHRRGKGGCGCGCGCNGCPMADRCHPKKSEKEQEK